MREGEKLKANYKGKLEHSIYCPCQYCEKCRIALRELITKKNAYVSGDEEDLKELKK